MRALFEKIKEKIKYVLGGLVVIAEDYDTELWDNPRKKQRIRRREKRKKEGEKNARA